MIDFTKNPPTIEFNEFVLKNLFFDLLKRQNEDGEGCHYTATYDFRQLQQLLLNMMEFVHIKYHLIYKDIRKLEDFSEDERRFYYPFAFMLACIDGNAFRSGDLNTIMENGKTLPPSPETISQYIPDAERMIRANGGTLDEIKSIIQKAAQ